VSLEVQVVDVAERTVAKKMGRPKTSERDDVTIKFDRILANKARQVAISKGKTLVEYLTELNRPLIDADYAVLLREIEGGGKGKK
jgi:hypothetical protein